MPNMTWQYNHGVPVLLVAVAVAGLLVAALWRRRSQRGAASLMVLVAAAGIWAFGEAMETGSVEMATKIWWSRLRYVGIVTVPPAWLVFSLQFSRLRHWVTPRTLMALGALPVANLIVVWTDQRHHLFWQSMWLHTEHGITLMASYRGPWYYVAMSTSYVYVLTGAWLLVRAAIRSHQMYRRQTVLLVGAVLLPLVSNLLFQFRLSPIPYMDLTPLTFSLAAFAMTWSFIRYGLLFPPMPVAKDQVLRSIRDGVLVLDLDRRILDVNPAASDMIDAAPERLIGRPANEFIDLPEALFGGSQDDHRAAEVTARSSAVSDRVLEAGVSALRTRWAGAVGSVVILRDVTERKQADLELRRLFTAMEHAAEDVTITDLEGTILYVNPAFERLMGYEREEVIGRRPNLLSSGSHDIDFYKGMWETLTTGKVWQGTITNRRKDGSLLKQETTISPIFDENRRMVGYVSIRRDVTEQEHLRAMLRQSQKTEALGRLAGGIAHDFNNLLAPVIGYAEMLMESFARGDERRDDLKEVVDAATRARSLTRQLLAVSRRQVLEFRPVDLNRTVTDLMRILRRTTRENVELVLDLAPALRAVRGDMSQIEQVIVNLVVNAQDAMSRGGRLSIRTFSVAAEEAPLPPGKRGAGVSFVALSVTDTGEGMSEEAQEHAFEPFFTTKGQDGGTGLGLATVHGIVEQHEGAVAVASEEGAGTAVTVYLPATDEEADPQGGDGRVPRSELELITKGTILLVEDDDAVRRVVSAMLGDAGFDVVSFGDGAKCVEAVVSADYAPDLLVTDVIMPGMGGGELVKRVREVLPELPVLFMSGHVDEVTAEEDLSAERVGFIQKPFTPEELESTLREIAQGAEDRA
ncbi:MAG: PAS domain S-box protein [bacterium]|nr:PAS domain S-box protein [bacterium]